MTSPLFKVLARTVVRSSLGEDALVESAVHGTVSCRATYQRKEVDRSRYQGEVEVLDAEPWCVLEEVVVPRLAKNDIIYVDGSLHQVRDRLRDGVGGIKAQLRDPDLTEGLVILPVDAEAGSTVAIAPVGQTPAIGTEIDDEWTVTSISPWGALFAKVSLFRT